MSFRRATSPNLHVRLQTGINSNEAFDYKEYDNYLFTIKKIVVFKKANSFTLNSLL